MADENTCRICHDAEPRVDLISPCHCNGFSRFVHRDCLAEWRRRNINQGYYRCEVCHFHYQYYRLWWGKVLESQWTSAMVSVLLMGSAMFATGQLSARSCNSIWHYFMHQGPSLLPHRLQVLFHGLFWVSLPGWYFLARAIMEGLAAGPFMPPINGPISIYNWPSSSSSNNNRAPPISPKSHSEEKEEEEEANAKEKATGRVTKYESPKTLIWIFLFVAASASFYKLFSKLHSLCREYCLRAQRLIENIPQQHNN
jgi:hypothetical protein